MKQIQNKNLTVGTNYLIKINPLINDEWSEYTGVYVKLVEGCLTFTSVTIDGICRGDLEIHIKEPYVYYSYE
jgi:hypothetical protein